MSGDHFGAYGDPPSSSELATRRAIRESEQLAEQLKLTIAENERLRAEIANLREAMEKQAKIGVAAMNNAIKLSDAELASAQRLRRESSPEALESERAANSTLTEELEKAQAEIEGAIRLCGEHAVNAREGLYASLAISVGGLAAVLDEKDKIIEQMRELLKMCDTTHLISPAIAYEVKRLCEAHGYGAVLATAQRQWEDKDSRGCFTLGPCKATVKAALEAAGRNSK